MQKNITKTLLLLSACMALNSCGTKGPLYIPEQRYPQAEPANSTPNQSAPTPTNPAKN